MDEGIHIDTALLREHVSVVQEEKRLAMQLQSQIELLKRISEVESVQQYQQILNKVDNLVQYYQNMADALDTAGDLAVEYYREIAAILQDDTDEAKSVISRYLL